MNIGNAKARMQKTRDYLQGELAKLRGSRTNPQLVEEIKVNVYGSQLPIKQLATVNVVDPTLITVQCWDKNNVEEIKKAISESELNVSPSVDGNIIRVPLPALTEERREELVKIVKDLVEDAKISIKRVRREFLDSLLESKNSEDELERGKKEIQKLVDEFNKAFDEEFERKQKELLTI